MAFQIIYSRQFLVKVLGWPQALKAMAFQAAEHTAQNPDLDDYKRQYLTPYRQKHPTSNHQYTLFFTPISTNEIYFVWINDTECLHETRANYPDPCLKEFQRLKAKGDLELYDPSVHHVRFEVKPDRTKPLSCRSTYLNHRTMLNTYINGENSFIGHAFYCDEPIAEIADIHVQEFLDCLYQHLKKNELDLQIQLTKQGHQIEADRLARAYKSQQWKVVEDPEDFILKII